MRMDSKKRRKSTASQKGDRAGNSGSAPSERYCYGDIDVPR